MPGLQRSVNATFGDERVRPPGGLQFEFRPDISSKVIFNVFQDR